jgi:hypothetical protein
MLATWWAMQLSRDVETCRALLRGEPVDPDRLYPEVLARAKARELVTLDFTAFDLLFPAESCRREHDLEAA